MIERDMRQKIVAALKGLHAVAVENGGACPGTPDINYRDGWIECKSTENWPAREDTPVRLDHDLTKQQRIWIIQRARVNGRVFVLLEIAGDWLLFNGMVAVSILGGKEPGTKAELFQNCLVHWNHTPTTDDLTPWLASN